MIKIFTKKHYIYRIHNDIKVNNYENFPTRSILTKIWKLDNKTEFRRVYLKNKNKKIYLCSLMTNEHVIVRMTQNIIYIYDKYGNEYFKYQV